MVTPEQACAFFSMLAAEQRLKVNNIIATISQQHNSIIATQQYHSNTIVSQQQYHSNSVISTIVNVDLHPELHCLYHKVISFIQDAGYGGKSLFAVEDEEEEDSSQKIDDEVSKVTVYLSQYSHLYVFILMYLFSCTNPHVFVLMICSHILIPIPTFSFSCIYSH